MRRRWLGAVAGGGAAVLAALALARPGAPAGVGSATVTSGGGITLASRTIALPVDDGRFPAGADAELVDSACTACHSASMALSQPPLTSDQWKAEVTKMREAYRAPIEEKDVPAIVAYLAAMPGQRRAGRN